MCTFVLKSKPTCRRLRLKTVKNNKMLQENAIYQINGGDLMAFGAYLIQTTKEQIEKDVAEQKSERYLSTTDVCQMLSLDPSSVWRYCKRNYLTPIYIGGKKRFKLSEIRKIMEGK